MLLNWANKKRRMISKISFSTSTPTLFPLCHHYKLTPVSTSTNLFPHHIAIHPPNSVSFPLIGLHNAKPSAPRPQPPTCTYTASRSSPPSSVQSICMFLLSTLLSFVNTLRILLHPMSTHLVSHWLFIFCPYWQLEFSVQLPWQLTAQLYKGRHW